MRIVVTGKTYMQYNRTQIILQGLKKIKGVEVIEFPITKRKKFDKEAFKKIAQTADFIYLPPFTHSTIGFIRRLTNKPIVFDPLISKYLTKVVDYGQWYKVFINYFKDYLAFRKCDLLIADTEHHKQYYSKMFGITKDRIHVIPVGVMIEEFKPMENQSNDNLFHVGFYGSFVPLQGAEVIIDAANHLKEYKDIVFDIIGTGHEYKKIQKQIAYLGLTNINLKGWIEYSKLAEEISRFDLCLGIFGHSKKADIVVPNKAFHYAAMRKCMLTKETEGIKEVFTHDKTAILCNADAKELAEHILKLKDNPDKREQIAKEAYMHISKKYNENSIAEKFIYILSNYQHKKNKL